MWYSFLSNNKVKSATSSTKKSPTSSVTAATAKDSTTIASSTISSTNYKLLSQNERLTIDYDDDDLDLNNSICCSISESSNDNSCSDDFEFDQLSVRSRSGTIMSDETGDSYEVSEN
jgi:hypothetical protein